VLESSFPSVCTEDAYTPWFRPCPGFAALIWVSEGLFGILTTEEIDVLLKGYMLCAGKTDSHRSKEEGTSRNAKPGEFAAADPKKPENNTPENAREKGGQ